MRKTIVLLVCICMHPSVSRMYPSASRMYPYVSRMYPYVSRMYPYVLVCSFRMLLVCHSYVTRMYSCGVLVMILKAGYTWIGVKFEVILKGNY